MNEYIVLLKDGSEVSIFAKDEDAAVQEAVERGMQAVEAAPPAKTLAELMSF